MSSLKGNITLGERAFCCSNKDTHLPRLQQSWCSRGRYIAAHADRKQLFTFPLGSSHLCHTERMQVSSVVGRKQKQEHSNSNNSTSVWGDPGHAWLKSKTNKNTSTSLGVKSKINKRKWGPRLSDKCLGRCVHLSPQCTLHWVTLQHETAEHLTDVYLVTQWKLTPFRTGGAYEEKPEGRSGTAVPPVFHWGIWAHM